MRRASAVLALLASLTAAQALAQTRLADRFDLTRIDADRAVLDYWNSDPPNTGYTPRELTAGDLAVQIEIEITRGPERLTVHAPEGWVAVPFSVDVADGDAVQVQIIRAAPGM